MDETLPGEASRERPDAAEDRLLGGRVRLIQPTVGYRAGMDAALPGGRLRRAAGERVIDAGCGPGAALLTAAARRPDARFVGVERDAANAALARRNLALNGMQDRAEIVEANVDGRLPRPRARAVRRGAQQTRRSSTIPPRCGRPTPPPPEPIWRRAG